MHIGLLIMLFFAHWLGDYTHLSTSRMLAAKRIGHPLAPIFHHAMVHAVLMFIAPIICLGLGKSEGIASMFFIIELTSHFGIDMLKGKMNVWFPLVSNPANKIHWYIFGLDQLLHQLVLILIWYLATTLL